MKVLKFTTEQLRDMLLQRWLASPPSTLAAAKRSLEIEIEQEWLRQMRES